MSTQQPPEPGSDLPVFSSAPPSPPPSQPAQLPLDEVLGDDWPWFLPRADGAADPYPEDLATWHALSKGPPEIGGRGLALLEQVADGAEVDDVGGTLAAAATAQALEAAALPARPINSMHDAPELLGAWIALVDGGWVVLDAGRAHPGDGIAPPVDPSDDPEASAEFTLALATRLLLSLAGRPPEAGGLRNIPDTVIALLAAASAGGVHVADDLMAGGGETRGIRIPQVPETDMVDADEFQRYQAVRHDLHVLVEYGLLRREGDLFCAGEMVVHAVQGLTDVSLGS